MMRLTPLPTLLVEPIVRQALIEDLGRAGDITTDAITPPDCTAKTVMAARQEGVIAGLDLAAIAFRLIDPAVRFKPVLADGAHVAPGAIVAIVEGPARGILSAERVALNFVSRLSGIASATARLAAAVAQTKARIVCTRKTTPLMRSIEKYAVRAGGGANHRFGLDDAALIKDNHIAIAGGVAEAIRRVRTHVGHLIKIEVEVDTLAQLEEALGGRRRRRGAARQHVAQRFTARRDHDWWPRSQRGFWSGDVGDCAGDRGDGSRPHLCRLAHP